MYKNPAKLPLAWPIVVQVRGPTRPSRFTRDATRPGMASQPSSVGTGHSSKAQAPRIGIRTHRGREEGGLRHLPTRAARRSRSTELADRSRCSRPFTIGFAAVNTREAPCLIPVAIARIAERARQEEGGSLKIAPTRRLKNKVTGKCELCRIPVFYASDFNVFYFGGSPG